MTPSEIDDFVRRYFDEWRVLHSGTRPERVALERAEDRASDQLFEIVHSSGDPERAWPITLALIEGAPDDHALAFVAAGPLEDLIQNHGEQFAERILEQARHDARFRLALRAVWGWERVSQSLRNGVFELLGRRT